MGNRATGIKGAIIREDIREPHRGDTRERILEDIQAGTRAGIPEDTRAGTRVPAPAISPPLGSPFA